ncbi:MAG: hypothetical protein HGA96_02655 [Desulfobulbaceae bacterium]|nr:hypothetical protein [Desulfobulbaceae bacterium]
MKVVNELDFSVDTQTQEAIVAIVGLEHLECVEDAIWVYTITKRLYSKRPSIPQMNKRFAEIRRHISALTDLLSDPQHIDYLLKIAVELDGGAGIKELLGKSPPFTNRIGVKLQVVEALQNVDRVCEASINKQTPGRGRPKGQKDEAVHSLLNNLCWCCERASGCQLTIKPNNTLSRLVKILKEPLGLGADLPGTIRKVITEHNTADKTRRETQTTS